MIHRDHRRPLVSEDMQCLRLIVKFGSGHDIFPDISDDGLSYVVKQDEEVVLSHSPNGDSDMSRHDKHDSVDIADEDLSTNAGSFKSMIASLERVEEKIGRIATNLKGIRRDLDNLSVREIRSRLDDIISQLG